MGCYKLRDFNGIFTFSVSDNTYPGSSLANYNIGDVLKVTLPVSLTGYPYTVTTCMQLLWDAGCPGANPHDLGSVTNYGFNNFSNCQSLIGVVSCTDPTVTGEFYISDETILNGINNCTSACNNCQPVLFIDAIQTPLDVGCYALGTAIPDNAYNIDFYNPTIDLICSNTPCESCSSTCYLVTLCNSATSPFIIANPTGSTLVLNQVVEAVITITPANSAVMTFSGCMTITELEGCNPIPSGTSYIFPIFEPTDVQIGNPPVTHTDCTSCVPPPNGFILRRCDDSNITFTASNNLSGLVGKVISGITITNCNSTFGICSSVLPEQCWTVEYHDNPGDFNIQYDTVRANCNCCPGPCD